MFFRLTPKMSMSEPKDALYSPTLPNWATAQRRRRVYEAGHSWRGPPRGRTLLPESAPRRRRHHCGASRGAAVVAAERAVEPSGLTAARPQLPFFLPAMSMPRRKHRAGNRDPRLAAPQQVIARRAVNSG
jgi:hypothetical protein